MATPNIVPRADSEGGLGTASKYWASAYIDNVYVSKIGRDADNLLNFSTDNHLVLRLNANDKLVFDGARMYPNSNDGFGLGIATHSFSDLFLASGAVINFDNGNVTLTHSSNALTLADGDYMQFGSSGDLQIYHSGTSSAVNNTTGDLYISNGADDSDIIFQCDDGSGGTAAYLTLDGSNPTVVFGKSAIFTDNIKSYFGTGLDLEIYHDGSNSYIRNNNDGGHLYIQTDQTDKDIIFQSDDGSGGLATYLQLDGSASIISVQKEMRFLDNVPLKLGNGPDFQMLHDGSNTNFVNSTGSLIIRNNTDDKDIIFESDNGAGGTATYFFLDGSSAAHDGSATTELYTNWPDKSYISLGTSHDFSLKHNGTQSMIHNNTGDLYMINYQNDGDISLQSDNGSGGITEYFRLDGGLGYSVAEKSIRMADGQSFFVGTGLDGLISHSGTAMLVSNEVGNFTIKNNANDQDIIFQCDDGSGGVAEYLRLDGTNVRTLVKKNLNVEDNVQLQIGNSQDLKLYHNTSHSFIEQQGTGNLYIQSLVDDGDIIFLASTGSAAPETYFYLDGSIGANRFPKNVLWDDNVKALFGGGSGDLQIYHSGSNSYIKDAGSGNLIVATNGFYLKNAADNEFMITAVENAAATLYYDNSAKLATAAGGIEVSGTIAGSSFRGVRKVVNSTTSNVATALSGQIYSFDDADGATVTLPDSGAGSYTGTTFEFVIKTTATSNSHKIILSDTTNEKFIGAVATIDTDNDNAATFYTPATSNKAITMNGTTTGITGSRIRITNIAADIWSVEGTILHTGNTATPFTNS